MMYEAIISMLEGYNNAFVRAACALEVRLGDGGSIKVWCMITLYVEILYV